MHRMEIGVAKHVPTSTVFDLMYSQGGEGVHCKPCGMRPPHFPDFQKSANNRIYKMKPDMLQVIQSEPFYIP